MVEVKTDNKEKVEFKTGDKVAYSGNIKDEFHPARGTIGTIMGRCGTAGYIVRWTRGSTKAGEETRNNAKSPTMIETSDDWACAGEELTRLITANE